MKRTTYLLVHNRANLQRIILPYLRTALHRAHSDLIVFDDCSHDPEVERCARALHPVAYIKKRQPDYISGHARTWRFRGQYAAMYADAQRRGLERWVVLDDDMLPGSDAIDRLHTADLTPEWPTVMPLATQRLREFQVHSNGYFSTTASRGLIDGAFVVHTATPVNHVAKIDVAGIPYASRLPRPQIEIQHLGYRGGTGAWHDAREFASLWVRRPCLEPLTGRPVEVDGFDLDLYDKFARNYRVDELSLGVGRVVDLSQDHPLVYHARYIDDPVLRSYVFWCDGLRRLLVVWDGLWQGNRTRRALGIPIRSRWVKLWPARRAHPWIAEYKRWRKKQAHRRK